MNLMNSLNRRFGRFGISNLMTYVTATMLAIYLMDLFLTLPIYEYLSFNRGLILRGQVWRLITFVFMPPGRGLSLWVLIGMYFYYFVGNSLENVWGSAKFTLYYLCGAVGLIVSGLIAGYSTNSYLNLSLFFAFAHLFPNNQVLLFFVIPIKIKYLAYINWIFFAYSFVMGNAVTRLAIVFSLINYFLFFGPDIFSGAKQKIRAAKYRRQMRQNKDMWR